MNAGMKSVIAAVLCACLLCGMACIGLAEGWYDMGNMPDPSHSERDDVSYDDGGWDEGGYDDGGYDDGGYDDGGYDDGTGDADGMGDEDGMGDAGDTGEADGGGSGSSRPSNVVPEGMRKKGHAIRLPTRRFRTVGIVPMPVNEMGMDPAEADSVVVAAAEKDAAPVIEDSMAEELLNVLDNEANRNSAQYAVYLNLAQKLGLGESAEEIVEALRGIVNR